MTTPLPLRWCSDEKVALCRDFHLVRFQEGWVKHLYDDWDAVVGRAKGLWAPRWRMASQGAIPGGASSGSLEASSHDGDNTNEQETSTRAVPASRHRSFGDGGGCNRYPGGKLVPTEKVGHPNSEPSSTRLAEDPRERVEQDQDRRVAVEADYRKESGDHRHRRRDRNHSPDYDDYDDDDDDDDWGGRGRQWPLSPRSTNDSSKRQDDRDTGAKSGGSTSLAAPRCVGGGSAKKAGTSRWARSGSMKGWSSARWTGVDVRAMQSRLSRIVDDTSARIRNSIVMKVTTRKSEISEVDVAPGGPGMHLKAFSVPNRKGGTRPRQARKLRTGAIMGISFRLIAVPSTGCAVYPAFLLALSSVSSMPFIETMLSRKSGLETRDAWWISGFL